MRWSLAIGGTVWGLFFGLAFVPLARSFFGQGEDHFWLLPPPYDGLLLVALLAFLLLFAQPLIAWQKGFAWRAWVAPSSFVGWLFVGLLPPANEPGIPEPQRARRERDARCAGWMQSAIGATIWAVGLIRRLIASI